MKDLQLNLSFVERGVRVFCAINGAFLFAVTQWFLLIPVLFYCLFTAMCGYCIIKAVFSMLTRKVKAKSKSSASRTIYAEKEKLAEA